jgi:hypothetical protein
MDIGNFITNQKLPGKRVVLSIMTEMTELFSPPGRPPTWHFSKTNKTKTSKVYPKYWPTKTEPFGSTSISLYGLCALNNQADTPLPKVQRQLAVPSYSLTPGNSIRIPYTGAHAEQSTRNSYAVQQHAHGINDTLNIANRTEKSTHGSAK